MSQHVLVVLWNDEVHRCYPVGSGFNIGQIREQVQARLKRCGQQGTIRLQLTTMDNPAAAGSHQDSVVNDIMSLFE